MILILALYIWAIALAPVVVIGTDLPTAVDFSIILSQLLTAGLAFCLQMKD